MIFRHQHAADRDLAAADVRMRVDAARHHNAPVQRIFLINLGARCRRDDAAVLDIDVANHAIDAVRGIVDFAAG